MSIIQLKINKKVYKSRNEFVHDLELVASNCKSYNGADSCKYYKKKRVCLIYLGGIGVLFLTYSPHDVTKFINLNNDSQISFAPGKQA